MAMPGLVTRLTSTRPSLAALRNASETSQPDLKVIFTPPSRPVLPARSGLPRANWTLIVGLGFALGFRMPV